MLNYLILLNQKMSSKVTEIEKSNENNIKITMHNILLGRFRML